jgi:hypothetical protein
MCTGDIMKRLLTDVLRNRGFVLGAVLDELGCGELATKHATDAVVDGNSHTDLFI